MAAILNWIWQGSVIAIVATLVLAAIERSSARDRYITVWVALLSVLALPLVPYVLQGLAFREVSGAPSIAEAPFFSMPVAWWTSNAMVLVLWGAWAGVAALRLAAAVCSLRRAKRSSSIVDTAMQVRLRHWTSVMATGRRTSLHISGDVRSAAVLGCGSPIIAIAPELLVELGVDELDRIVIHEWAHVQRRDDLRHVLQSGIRVVAGWHPAVWWLDRLLNAERENACDEMAVAVTGSAKGYAASLVKLASLPALRALAASPLSALGPVGLRRRIVRILSRDGGAAATPWRFAAAGSSASLCVLALVLGDVRAIEARVERELETVTNDTRWIEESAIDSPSAIASSHVAPVVRPEPLRQSTNAPGSDRLVAAADAETPIDAPDAVPRSKVVASESQAELISASHVSGALSATAPRTLTAAATATVAVPSGPWREVGAGTAAAGMALGRESHGAAVASASYFTRLGKRIASSF